MITNDAEYQRNHKAMRLERGKASENECVDCEKQAHDWSQIHDTDGTDPWDHYEPRCRSCHQKYDMTEERRKAVGDMYRGKKHTDSSRDNMSLAHSYGDGTTCKRGHDLTDPVNVRRNRGPRSCAECHREDSRKRRMSNAG